MRTAPRRGGVGVGVVVAFAMILAFLGAVFGMLLVQDRLTSGSDVGDLPELAGVQATLRPLDVCRMEYMLRTVGVNQDKRGRVRIYRCSNELMPFPIYFDAPAAVSERSISFLFDRSSREKPFAIRVDKSRVAFGDLSAALQALAPDVSKRYPAMRAAADVKEQKDKEDLRRQEAERDRAHQSARDSYPTH